MRKLKRFSLPSSCKSLCNEAMIEIVGGGNDTTCKFNSSSKSCTGTCSYAGRSGSCVYGTVGTLTGCYCSIS
jgi:hypothetical protein